MAVLSARVDDKVKADAESIANSIGLPLSSVMNIFLRRFIAERGFPFDVVEPVIKAKPPVFEKAELLRSFKAAIADGGNPMPSDSFAFLDPATQELKTERIRREP